MTDPLHLSYSELRDYKRCPKKFRLKQTGPVELSPDRLRRTFLGDLVQALVERFYRDRLWLKPAPLQQLVDSIDALQTTLAEKYEIRWSPDDREELWHKARAILFTVIETVRTERLLGPDIWVEEELEQGLQIKADPCDEGEPTVRVKKGTEGRPVVLHGRPDLLIRRAAELTLLDGKTGRLADVDQLRYYAILVGKTIGQYPTRAGFWWYRRGVVTWKDVSEKKRQTFLAATVERLKGILAGKFDPTPASHCRSCDVLHRCGEGQEYLRGKALAGVPISQTSGRATRLSL